MDACDAFTCSQRWPCESFQPCETGVSLHLTHVLLRMFITCTDTLFHILYDYLGRYCMCISTDDGLHGMARNTALYGLLGEKASQAALGHFMGIACWDGKSSPELNLGVKTSRATAQMRMANQGRFPSAFAVQILQFTREPIKRLLHHPTAFQLNLPACAQTHR